MSKKKNNFKGNRILKNDSTEIKSGDISLNPLTLMIVENPTKDNIYFSKFHFNDNDELFTTTFNKDLKLKSDALSTPPILIPQNDFLKIHKINDINDLIQYIDNNDSDNSFNYNNRLINCFIRLNYKDLLKNNEILSNIYLKLFKNYKTNIKEITKFIKTWFKIKNDELFFLNLGDDLKNYLSKKYES